jgi:trehalose 6-phosphate phosphatase
MHLLLDHVLGIPADRLALFVDFDGTLVDIAPHPSGVSMLPDVLTTLRALFDRLGGALAIVTGRHMADISRIITDPAIPIAASYSAEWHGLGVAQAKGVAAISDLLAASIARTVMRFPGATTERKPLSLAVHFRSNPAAEQELESTLSILVRQSSEDLRLIRGRRVLEVVPRVLSKRAAVHALMSLPVFFGRLPVAIGDDLADLEAFEATRERGGIGLRVCGETFPLDQSDFTGPAHVRSWLAQLSSQSNDRSALPMHSATAFRGN